MTSLKLDRRHFMALSGATAFTLGAGVPLIARGADVSLAVTNAGGVAPILHQVLLRNLGYMEEMGVDTRFENVTDGSRIIASLIGGTTEACLMAGIQPVMPAIERGAELKLIAGANLLPGFAMVSTNPEIRTLEDLRGRNVGTGTPGALTHVLTSVLLRRRGMDPSEVTFANVGSTADILRAVVGGVVDAGLVTVTVYNMQDRFGVHAIEGGVAFDEVPEYIFQGSFASERAIAENREGMVRALAAHAKLYRYLQGPDSYDDFEAAYLEVQPSADAEEAKAEWDYIQATQPYAADLVLPEENIAYMQELNIESGSQSAILPYEEVVDISLAHEAVEFLESHES